MAKEPVPGRVKTRLTPPFSPYEAAQVAETALAETLDAVARCGADRKVVALDGEPGPWLPAGFEVVAQADGPLDARLAHAWEHVGGMGVQIGMDTPQVTPELLDGALATLFAPGCDAVLGLAVDGGWWAIGLRRADREVFRGVPMSTPRTGAAQLARLRALRYRVGCLPVLRDLDTVDDAVELSAHRPDSATGRLVADLLAVPLRRRAAS